MKLYKDLNKVTPDILVPSLQSRFIFRINSPALDVDDEHLASQVLKYKIYMERDENLDTHFFIEAEHEVDATYSTVDYLFKIANRDYANVIEIFSMDGSNHHYNGIMNISAKVVDLVIEQDYSSPLTTKAKTKWKIDSFHVINKNDKIFQPV
jgi:hypothetical protein